MAYLPVLDLLKSYFDIADDDREFIIRKKIEEKILCLDKNLKSVLTPFHDLLSLKLMMTRICKLTLQKEKCGSLNL